MTTKKNNEKTSMNIDLAEIIKGIEEDRKKLENLERNIIAMQDERSTLFATIKEQVTNLFAFTSLLNKEQQAYIESLDLVSFTRSKRTKSKGTGKGNALCTKALEILKQSKQDMTNEALHHAYIDSVPSGTDAPTYTAFNIALRPLINSGTITRTFTEQGNSKTAIIKVADN